MEREPIGSRMSIAGHPIHPTLIHFPVAALLGLAATDLAFIVTGDPFWARAGFWLATVGAGGGWFAGLIGFVDLVSVRSISQLLTAWSHALLAVMMLSLASFNWLLRLEDFAMHIWPWGIYMSCLTGGMIVLASLMGGQLVYDHGVGVGSDS